MKRLAAVCGLLFFASGLWAQTKEGEIFLHPLGPQTADAFRATCSRLAQHLLIRGNFEQEKTISRLNRSLKSSGNFLIVVGQGMVWDTAKPFPSTLTLGKDFMVQSRPGGQRTVLNTQENETFLRMAEVISAIFSGNAQGLLDNFAIYYLSDANAASDTAAWELGLSPLDKTINFFAEKIIIKGDAAIRSIQLYEQNGDSIKYILSNHSYPAELSAHEKTLFSH